tara:strand:+ start:290 stop:1276 length:987 start_codon:yes stop_codon:yes gene_type:complete
MAVIFDALPGMDVPAEAISKSLAQMWAETHAAGKAAPSAEEAKATQVNFVLHFGFQTTADDARQQFATTVEFSKRYPSRVVVLCPSRDETFGAGIRAKVYGECFLGKSKGDTRCVEFVILSYPMAARAYLEDLVSTCLSTDLPLYYWAHRFSSATRLNDYQYLLRASKRIMVDSAVVPLEALAFNWPKPEALRDLVHARLLPVRQGLGQFLSGFSPKKLVGGLKIVTVTHQPERSAEALVLREWLKPRLAACGKIDAVEFSVQADAGAGAPALAVTFGYDGDSTFSWAGYLSNNHATYEADFGDGAVKMTTGLKLLDPAAALSEAVFF